MTFGNLCSSCANIGCEFQSGIVRTKCAFYMPSRIEPDNCGNYVVMQPTAEAVPKADIQKALKEGSKDIIENVLTVIREEYISKSEYEARLKTDMASVIDNIRAEIEQKARPNEIGGRGNGKSIRYGLCMALEIIDKYRTESEETNADSD